MQTTSWKRPANPFWEPALPKRSPDACLGLEAMAALGMHMQQQLRVFLPSFMPMF